MKRAKSKHLQKRTANINRGRVQRSVRRADTAEGVGWRGLQEKDTQQMQQREAKLRVLAGDGLY